MKKYIYLLLFFSFCSLSFAQTTSNPLIIESQGDSVQVLLKWFPTDAKNWNNWNKTGYTISRQKLDSALRNVGTSQIIGKTNLKNKEWFVLNAENQRGIIGAIGQILYDSAFNYTSPLLDATSVKYNYSIYEAEADFGVATALGLAFRDTTVLPNTNYKYEISTGTTKKSIIIHTGQTFYERNPATEFINYDFAGGKPLSFSLPSENIQTDKIFAQSKSYGDSIVIRFAPNSYPFWQKAIDSGFLITRYKLGVPNYDSSNKKETLVKVWKESQITPYLEIFKKDSLSYVALQVLYGKEEMTNSEGFFDNVILQENKFTMALYAAERSKLAAEILGLVFVDKEVEKGESYQYIITSTASNSGFGKAELIIENTIQEPEKVDGIEVEQLDHQVTLKWNRESNQTKFSAYKIERSDDEGKTYKALSNRPIIFLEEDNKELPYFKYTDSLEKNYKTYYYRLIGLNSFAEESPAEIIKTFSIDLTPPPTPLLLEATLSKDRKQMKINFYSTGNLGGDFDHYTILLGNGLDGKFEELGQANKGDTVFYYQIENDSIAADKQHFFRVAAQDTSGNKSISDTKFVFYPDLIAPQSPTNLEGFIDENGVATVYWEHSKSQDVTSYWLYVANSPNDNFSPVNKGKLEFNTFQDTLSINSLNEKIYYFVRAEDDNYNKSEPSKILVLERPDNVPPIAPLIEALTYTDSAIVVNWKFSSSEDVILYEIYRREAIKKIDTEWKIIAITSDSLHTFKDNSIQNGTLYQYKIRAKDDANLFSKFSQEVTGRKNKEVFNLVTPILQTLTRNGKEMQLSWNYTLPIVLPNNATSYKFYIYRSYGASNLQEIGQTNSTIFQFTDSNIEEGALYNYAIKVIFDNGISTDFSQIQSILYE